MKIRLKDIADIITGTLFNNKVDNDINGDLSVIQLRDVENGEIVSYEDLFKVKSNDINKAILLSIGDIIFTAKTVKHNSIYIGDVNHKLTATSHFLIIRVKNKEVNPRYLSWFLNQKPAQNDLNRLNQGMMIPSINKRMLESLIITIPDMKIQENIANIDDLLKREMSLLEEYKTKKQLLIQAVLLKTIEKEGYNNG